MREFLKIISILITSLKSGVFFKEKKRTHIRGIPVDKFLLTIGTWIGFFFLSLLAEKKNHQILHIH